MIYESSYIEFRQFHLERGAKVRYPSQIEQYERYSRYL